jgi:glycosyltransferase involved in cell wall biosynthesis
MMTRRPIAYVMEQTLGNVTHYLNLRREEAVCGNDRPLWIPIQYRTSRLPWTVTGSLLARRALRPVLDQIDGMFIHTSTLTPLVADCFWRRPAVLSSDGTPLNKRTMRAAYGLKARGHFAELGNRAVYRRIFARAVGFVGWSEWTKQSFVEDYGCREEDVMVIPPGIDLQLFEAGDRHHELPRLLFVGGDFVRKGGDLLLDVFRRRLRGRAELILVTQADVPAEPGVTVYQNVQANSDQLRNLFATSDLFVLPTRGDCFSLVYLEALASGLPIVATRVGGIPDLVREAETGFMIDVDDSKKLGDVLESLVGDPAGRREMGDAGRVDAARRFDSRENSRRLFEFVRSRCGTS